MREDASKKMSIIAIHCVHHCNHANNYCLCVDKGHMIHRGKQAEEDHRGGIPPSRGRVLSAERAPGTAAENKASTKRW